MLITLQILILANIESPMLDMSQISQIQQPQARSLCPAHPGFGFDTICFSPACRQRSSQIICSFCSELQPHASHIDQQYAIHRTSPGFRSINFTKDWHKLPQLIRQREAVALDFNNLKNQLTQLIDQMMDRSLRRLQCLSLLLRKNAASQVCHKIRQNHRIHVQCCVKVINELQMRQQGNSLCKEQAYTLIEDKLRSECFGISNRVEVLRSNLVKLFGDSNYDKKGHILDGQIITQTNTAKQQIGKSSYKDQREVHTTESLLIVEPINLNLSPNNPQIRNDSRIQLEINQQSFVRELTFFESQPQSEATIDLKLVSKRKPPIGIDIDQEGTITVWDANTQAINYLRHCQNIRNLIIEDSSITNTNQFRNLIQSLPQLQGIHINCKSSIDLKVLKDLKVSYLNLFPSFRFIQNTDRSKYFPKVETTILKRLPQHILDVYICAKHHKKNRYLINGKPRNIQTHIDQIEQINLIQRYQGEQCIINERKIIYNLNFTTNLLVLVFSNVSLEDGIGLSKVYMNNSKLHTVVFDNCKGNHKRFISQFKNLRPKQLRHLQISGDKLQQRISLPASSTKRLFFHQSLETLILTKVSFRQQETKESSFLFQRIGKLARLTHLNLYDSWPIQAKILQLLHRNCRKQLRYLNIGCSQITDKQKFYKSPPFSNLQSLCLDYTQINQTQLAIFMKNSISLKYLSIQNLNGERIEREQTEQRDNNKCYGLITPQFFRALHTKNLKYVNIYNCFSFSEYSWEGFDELECIRVNEGLLSQRAIGILKSKGIKLNIVKKDQLSLFKTKSVKNYYIQMKQFQNGTGLTHIEQKKPKDIHQLEYIKVESNDLSIQGEDAINNGFTLFRNKGQSISRVTNKMIPFQNRKARSIL